MASPPKPQIFRATQLAGDYNGDDHVDAGDYILWRKTLGSMTNLQADGNHDGIVDSDDEQVWRANFGSVGSAGAGAVGAIERQSLESRSFSDAVSLQVFSDVPNSDGHKERFSRLSGSARPAVETTRDLALVLLSARQNWRQDPAFDSHRPGNSEVDEIHALGRQLESVFHALGSALVLKSTRDFHPFMTKF